VANEVARDERQKHASQQIVTRAEAREAGHVRYFTGLPCSNGHVVERLTSSGGCVVCSKQTYDNWRRKNPEKNRAAAAAWAAANPEKVKARNKAIYAADPEFWKQRSKKWRMDNPEKAREVDARSREKHAARIREYRKIYWEKVCRNPDQKKKYQEKARVRFAENPGLRSVYRSRRRAMLRAAEGSHTANDVQKIYKAQKGRCACCRKKVSDGYHVDHIIPLAKGGSNWPKNLQITCPPCNQKKQARDPIQFMQSLGCLL
jgi:5-methylcytosine-specific restriction endonuclease McrA